MERKCTVWSAFPCALSHKKQPLKTLNHIIQYNTYLDNYSIQKPLDQSLVLLKKKTEKYGIYSVDNDLWIKFSQNVLFCG